MTFNPTLTCCCQTPLDYYKNPRQCRLQLLTDCCYFCTSLTGPAWALPTFVTGSVRFVLSSHEVKDIHEHFQFHASSFFTSGFRSLLSCRLFVSPHAEALSVCTLFLCFCFVHNSKMQKKNVIGNLPVEHHKGKIKHKISFFFWISSNLHIRL